MTNVVPFIYTNFNGIEIPWIEIKNSDGSSFFMTQKDYDAQQAAQMAPQAPQANSTES